VACIGSAAKWEQVPGITDVRDIMEDRDGVLRGLRGSGVCATENRPYNHEQGLANDAVYDVVSDSNGSLWVATPVEDRTASRRAFQGDHEQRGAVNNMLVQLHERRGQLWVSSNQDIFRFELKQLNDFLDGSPAVMPVSYGIAEGMRSSEQTGQPGHSGF
jgi:ligand-binding sensor domain-containing protein